MQDAPAPNVSELTLTNRKKSQWTPFYHHSSTNSHCIYLSPTLRHFKKEEWLVLKRLLPMKCWALEITKAIISQRTVNGIWFPSLLKHNHHICKRPRYPQCCVTEKSVFLEPKENCQRMSLTCALGLLHSQ